jgi:hypothetical protein
MSGTMPRHVGIYLEFARPGAIRGAEFTVSAHSFAMDHVADMNQNMPGLSPRVGVEMSEQ